MYLRATTEEQIKATDVFRHRRKWWSLYMDSVVLTLLTGWPIAFFGGILKGLFDTADALRDRLSPSIFSIIFISFIAAFFLLLFLSFYKESKHLHALNLAAEFGLRGPESRHLSRKSVKNRWKDTIFVILLSILSPLFFFSAILILSSIPTPFLFFSTWLFFFSMLTPFFFLYSLIFTSIILSLLTLTMGATAMAFLHDLGEKEEIFELVKKYKELYKREAASEVENPCPTCDNSNVYRAQTKFGYGDWCPDCKMSLKEMRGMI